MRSVLSFLAALALAVSSACTPANPAAPSVLVVTAQPQSQTIVAGATASLSVSGSGAGPVRYQWYRGQSGTTSTPIAGADTASYLTPPLVETTSFWVRLSDGHASVDSSAATITVQPPNGGSPPAPPAPPPPAPPAPTAPAVTGEPQDQTIPSGQTTTLSVSAGGSAPLSYQWYWGQRGDVREPINGATGTTLTTPPLTATSRFWARVTNAAGAADSRTATVTVMPPPGVAPAITSQPQGQTITSGSSATLSVAAGGTAPLSYQWYRGSSGDASSPIGGAMSATLATGALTTTTSYWVRVANGHGVADSATAVVTVTPDESGSPWEDAVLSLVNQHRAAGAMCGGTAYAPAPALVMNAQLRTAARGHSQDMAANNYFSHTSQDGRTFDQRIHNAGYWGSPLGENIAAGQGSPAAVVAAWMSSPGHCANIMSPGYRAIGVGYGFNSASTYRHYWTQAFGGS